MNRSLRNRRLTGAFLGGILGILTFGYLLPFLMPVGCFLGVLVGYFGDTWVQKIREEIKRIEAVAKVGDKRSNIEKIQEQTKNRAIALTIFMSIFCTLMSAIFLLTIYNTYHGQYFTSSLKSDLTHGILFFVISGAIMTMALASCSNMMTDREEKLGTLFVAWQTHGTAIFSVLYMWKLLVVTVFMIAYTTILLMYGFIALPLASFFGAISLVVVGTVKGSYKLLEFAIKREGLWVSYIITLITCSCFAWFGYPYFSDQRFLWTTALAAGLGSAALTDVAFAAIRKWVKLNPKKIVTLRRQIRREKFFVPFIGKILGGSFTILANSLEKSVSEVSDVKTLIATES